MTQEHFKFFIHCQSSQVLAFCYSFSIQLFGFALVYLLASCQNVASSPCLYEIIPFKNYFSIISVGFEKEQR